MNNSQELAIFIKQLAKEKSISIRELLENSGVSKNTLSSMQSGGYMPRLDTIARIADCLDVSIDYLLDRRFNNPNLTLAKAETKLIEAYREHPEMHDAVHRILGINEPSVKHDFRLAAFGGDNVYDESDDEPRIT